MAGVSSPSLVETDWLFDHLSAPDIVVVDASWHLPPTGRSGLDEYREAHIPGARFFDINTICDSACDLPHMLPDAAKFVSAMKSLGIGDGVRVVAYDSEGIFAAARVWWMLRVMGHNDVSVLNGGMAKWAREGRPVTDEPPDKRSRAHFTPRTRSTLVVDFSEMEKLSLRAVKGDAQIVDARPTGRFSGLEPEPRPGLRLGHIPGSVNVPFGCVLNGDGTMKDKGELTKLFAGAKIDPNSSVTATCGSGVSAAVLALALAQLGNDTVAVYDGAWAEWGADGSDLPIETG